MSGFQKSQQNSSPAFPGSAGSVHYHPRISVHVGITQCSSRFSSFESPSYETSSVPSSGSWKPHCDSLDLSIPISRSCHVSIKWWMNPTIYLTGIPLVIPSPDFHLFSDASYSGWGAHLEPLGLEVQGLWDCFPRPSCQLFGVTSSFSSTPTFSDSHLQLLHDGSVKQFISSGLPQKTRRDPLSISVHASMGAPLLVSSLKYSHSSQAYSRAIECFSRQSVSPRLNSPHQMVSRSGDCSPDFQALGYSSSATRLNHLLPLFVFPVPDTGLVQWMLCP